MTNAFGYLTVLISIILGLGITHLLSSVARSISRRATIKFYWPTFVWILVVLVLIVQVWWVDFSLSGQRQWTLAGFASTLLIPAVLYLMSFLVVNESDDMRATYFENRVWFFSLLMSISFFGALQKLLVEGHVHGGVDLIAKSAGEILIVGAIIFRSDSGQKIFAIVGIVFIVAYVWGLFYYLPTPA